MRRGVRQQTSEADITIEPDLDGVAEAERASHVQHGHDTWNALSVLASEYAHAVRKVYPGDRPQDQDGHVEVEWQPQEVLPSREQQNEQTDPSCATAVDQDPVAPSAHNWHDKFQGTEILADSDDVTRAEAARVRAKFASVDASTEVVLRFDFMNEHATRVRDRISVHTNSN